MRLIRPVRAVGLGAAVATAVAVFPLAASTAHAGTSHRAAPNLPAAPVVTSVAPSSGPQAGSTTVTVDGSGFTAATAVDFGKTAATNLDVISDTELTVTSPAGSGTVDVTVTTPAGTSSTSSADEFAYVPPPTVSSVSPTSGPQPGGTTVTITGTGFTGATGVDFGSVAATAVTVKSATSITATSPAGSGTVDVTVIGPDGTSAKSSGDTFTYNPPPAVTSISPTSGYETGGTTVTITGTGFNPSAAADDVEFGDAGEAEVVSASATKLVVHSPESEDTGAVDVTVRTGNGTSATSAKDKYTYLATVPVLAIAGGNASLYVSANGGSYAKYGGALNGAPAIISTNDRNYYIVRGTNNNLYVRDDKSTFTRLRVGAPLDCATAPAAQAVGDGRFTVGCVGTNGKLYTAAGSIPATGNPTITTIHAAPGTYNSDLTATKGGVSADGEGDFLVTGAAYAASGPVSQNSADTGAYPAGDTYALGIDDQTGTVATSGDETELARIGGSCAGAPQASFDDFDGYYLTCRSTTSAATVVYKVNESSSNGVETATEQTLNVGGAAIGSPVATVDASDGEFEVLVTGTNGKVYDAVITQPDTESAAPTTTGFHELNAGIGASGPGISVGPPPSATTKSRRALTGRW